MLVPARFLLVVGVVAVVVAAAGASPATVPRVSVALTANDPFYGLADAHWPYTLTHIDVAWGLARGSSAVTIAVIDSGVDSSQLDLAGSVLPGYNAFAGGHNSSDDNGHGTAVAAVAAAHTNNWLGGVGICDGCRILPVKVVNETGLGLDADIAAGIVWAVDHRARIVNLSLGGNRRTGEPPVAVGSRAPQRHARLVSQIGDGQGGDALAAAVTYAQAHNVLVVAAAGNDGTNTPTYPAAYPGVLSVAAIRADGTLTRYSDHGRHVMVAAPGYATAPQGHSYRPWFGTSLASAYVAGLAGLALSANPTLTATQLRALIEHTATPGIDVAYGRINAQTLIQAVRHTTPTP